MSTEIKVKEYNTEGDTYRKYRISFTDPNKLFKVDLTAITEGSYVERSFILKPDSLETFQVEVEFLSNKIDINNLFKFFTSMLSLNK